MIRKTKKIRKQRGSRSVGGGCTKKRRGAGHRGGRGLAGGNKHLKTWMVINDPNHFGKYGFKRPQKTIQKFNPINLSTINDNVEKYLDAEIATKEDGQIVIDITELGYNKVLGKGSLSEAMTIKAPQFSKSAIAKIEDAGGVAEII
ncbi:uL15m family ribosomal protein [Methanosphaera cuniculi]|uniref:Large ribosomal subunit protein uL15 n=1 Tax=Methanosphaera cuniculi TaxID=1077256 RepID=A0A2A2HBG2_9EURY|nr:uL15m family ribosomal protein [Methanosphaera cuniculi]PAV06650.1 50S ribosomal protein L15 [Methanosphaera cuniculi]PWL07838.1 50S ribosomal protein L15 [Methanosphaera cuniculi]